MRSPLVSVLLPVFNGEKFIQEAISSVLGQTFENFELIVVDDGSTDSTREILARFQDPRLVVLPNEINRGLVWSLNFAASRARGKYIARLDADDIALPVRFARQLAVLENSPEIVLLGSLTWELQNGRTFRSPAPYDPDIKVTHWLMHVINPLSHPTMMFRADVIQRLGVYMREEYFLAEDFDFSHRASRLGGVWVMPERLILYRRHEASLTGTSRRELLQKRTAAVLTRVHAELVGEEAPNSALLVASELITGGGADDPKAIAALGDCLEKLMRRFLERHELSEAQQARIKSITAELWWRRIQHGLRRGLRLHSIPRRHEFDIPGAGGAWPPLLAARLRGSIPAKPLLRAAFSQKRPTRPATKTVRFSSVEFRPAPPDPASPPRLYVVVDTEAEFDWGKPFNRSLVQVSAMASQERAQSIFEGYGLRPIYVIDYAVASQPEGYEPLRAILDRGACAIGAHLHPWVNPPFYEDVSERNSYPGNLPAELERAKLEVLLQAIRSAFRLRPLFYKAGRFGIGPNTYPILQELGFAVDLSILPGADFRAQAGPDLRMFQPVPYRVEPGGMLSLPVTRGQYGPLKVVAGPLGKFFNSRLSQQIRAPAVLRRLGLANSATMSPEGMSTGEQIALIRHQLRAGYKDFVLYYHSPSLFPGHTPYVRTDRDLMTFLSRLKRVCRAFFDQMGGLPGNPADLVAPEQRPLLRPMEQAGVSEAVEL